MSSDQEFSFSNLENGLDFLLRALEYLEGKPSHRELKYAVLHLHSGIELILKEPIRREYWSLIFEKPEDATKEKYLTGDFRSVSWETCLKRLKGVCGIDISETENRALNILKNKRNRLEHFGIIDNIVAVKSSTVPVLNFAIDFINGKIRQETMSGIEQQLLQKIRENLGNFKDFVYERMQIIQPELETFQGSVVTCPRCSQETWTIDYEIKCLFCGYRQVESESAKNEYVENVLGIDWHSIADGDEEPVYQCPNCGMDTLVDVSSLQQFDKPRFICFSCAVYWTWEELDFCGGCGRPCVLTDSVFCDDCNSWRMEKND